jgi:NitT/TauT family transport system permease protein
MKADAATVKQTAVEELPVAKSLVPRDISRAKQIALPIVAAGAVLILWEIVVRAFGIPSVILPPPSEVWETFLRTYPLLMQHAVPTMLETVIGFVLAVILGVALAVIITYSPTWRAALYPNLVFFQLIPKVALAPLFIVWLGIGMESRLFFALFISFFPIVISMATGLTEVDRSLLRLCRSLTATEWQVFVHVRFPFALPYLFSGMKIGMTMAMIGVIVGEFITAQAGLGYLIVFATSRAETAVIMAAIGVLCALGLALYGLVVLGELGMKRWYYGRSLP